MSRNHKKLDEADARVGHYSTTATLSEEEIARINAGRPPSEQLKPTVTCGATKPNGMGACGAKAGSGTDHPGWGYCTKHGGNTQAGKKHAARLQGKEILAQRKHDWVKFGGDRSDPSIAALTAEQALLEEVRRSVAMVRWLEEQIGQWDYGQHLLRAENESWDDENALLIERSKGRSGVRPPSPDAAIEEAQAVARQEAMENPELRGLPVLMTETAIGVSTSTNKAEWLRLYREERTHAAKVAKMCIDSGIAQRMVAIAEDQGRILSSALRAVLTMLALNAEQEAMVSKIVPPVLRAVAQGQPIPSVTTLIPPAASATSGPAQVN